jgi:hypothetical protein
MTSKFTLTKEGTLKTETTVRMTSDSLTIQFINIIHKQRKSTLFKYHLYSSIFTKVLKYVIRRFIYFCYIYIDPKGWDNQKDWAGPVESTNFKE